MFFLSQSLLIVLSLLLFFSFSLSIFPYFFSFSFLPISSLSFLSPSLLFLSSFFSFFCVSFIWILPYRCFRFLLSPSHSVLLVLSFSYLLRSIPLLSSLLPLSPHSSLLSLSPPHLHHLFSSPFSISPSHPFLLSPFHLPSILSSFFRPLHPPSSLPSPPLSFLPLPSTLSLFPLLLYPAPPNPSSPLRLFVGQNGICIGNKSLGLWSNIYIHVCYNLDV